MKVKKKRIPSVAKQSQPSVGDLIIPEGSDEILSITEVMPTGSCSKSERSLEMHFVVACKIRNGKVLKRVERFRGYNWAKA